MTELAIDSHALLWFLDGDPKLSARAKAAMASDRARWFIPAICACEIELTIRKGKYSLASEELHRVIRRRVDTHVVAIGYAIARRAVQLTALDGIHDQLIIAATITLRDRFPTIQLLTSDSAIQDSELVPTLW